MSGTLIPVESMSTQALRVLSFNDIDTLEQLAECTEADLLRNRHGATRVVMHELREYLRRHGRGFRDAQPTLPPSLAKTLLPEIKGKVTQLRDAVAAEERERCARLVESLRSHKLASAPDAQALLTEAAERIRGALP